MVCAFSSSKVFQSLRNTWTHLFSKFQRKGKKFSTQVSISEFLSNFHFKRVFAMTGVCVGDCFSLIFSYKKEFIIKVSYYFIVIVSSLLLLYAHSTILPSFLPLVFLQLLTSILKAMLTGKHLTAVQFYS